MGRNVKASLLIENEDREGEGASIEVLNPATEERVAIVRGASPSQVDAAVKSSRNAFESGVWSDPAFRRETLVRFADLIVEHGDALMACLIDEIGTPISLKGGHIGSAADFIYWFADQCLRDRMRHLGPSASGGGTSMIAYRPVGVVAAISAFNYPILISASKLGAALAAGCTAVLLSSPQAPLAVSMLGDLVRKAGFPPGVVNILAGGAEVGRALTEHEGVDKVTFTGSVNVGRAVLTQAASGLKGAVLELGGKSAAILLPGADFDRWALMIHTRYARNAGQGCGSPTRILVEEARYDEFCEASRKVYPRIKVGDPRDPATILGPVISAAQRDRIEAGIKQALDDGARIEAGGGRPDFDKGWFLNPTLVGGLSNAASLARHEIFGPVAVVLTYRTVAEAVQIANDSDFGLRAFLFGPTAECIRLAAELRVGTVQINGGGGPRSDAPMAGYKQSGLGVEWGEDGLREFLLPQHIDVAFA
jgi:aldehyde dehydrogenase (NAD+)